MKESPSIIFDIFVFGSNKAGRHSKGAALKAVNSYGAIYNQGRGAQGNSYAIPTKDEKLNVLDLIDIIDEIRTFIGYALKNPQVMFMVTRVGCGLSGYSDQEIGPMFQLAPINCIMPIQWHDYLPVMQNRKYHDEGKLNGPE